MIVTPKTPFPTTIAASGSWESGIMPFLDMNAVSASVKSTQAGTLTIQAYLDNQGNIPIGTAVSATLTADTLVTASLTLSAGSTPFAALSYQVTISNTGSSPATISDTALVLQQL